MTNRKIIQNQKKRVKLLELATKKFLSNNDDIKLSGSIYNLILECYIKYEPSKRGNTLEKLIRQDLNNYVSKVPQKWKIGDFAIRVRDLNNDSRLKQILNYLYSKELESKIGDKSILKKIKDGFIERVIKSFSIFFELKTSYLNNDGNYTICGIRPNQNYDYLLLLLVDCEDTFKQKLIMIPKSELGNIKMSNMYGIKNTIDDVNDSPLSFSIKKGSDFERDLDKWLVEDCFVGLEKIIQEKTKTVYNNIKNVTQEQYNYIVNEEIITILNNINVSDLIYNNKNLII